MNMQKTEVIHTRVSPEVKAECDYIFSQLGITTSYAISLFLSPRLSSPNASSCHTLSVTI